MTHVLCHSLQWSENHTTRCTAMLQHLKKICHDAGAILVLLGDVVHGVNRHGHVSITALHALKNVLQGVPLHVVPAHEHDRRICALLNIPCIVDDYLDDVYCCFETSSNEPHVYDAKQRKHVPALFPKTSKEYSSTRHVVLRTPLEIRRIPFPCGPKMHTWNHVDADLTGVRGGDLVRLINPTIGHMARCRALQHRGARIQTIQQRPKPLVSFWEFFNKHLADHPARENMRSLLEDVIHEPVRIRLNYIRVENIGKPEFWIDMSGSGVEWVGGTNGSGKTTLFVHVWCWLMLGIWRGQTQPHTVGINAFAECAGTLDGIPFSLQRRVGQYEHVCRLVYNGHDETRDTPSETTAYMHERLFKWEGTSSQLYQTWMQHLILQKSMIIKWCPHVHAIRKVFVKIRKRATHLKRLSEETVVHIQTLNALIMHLCDMRTRYKEVHKEWLKRRQNLLQHMTLEYERLCAVKAVERPEMNPHEPFDEELARLEDLRGRYFDVIRRRRSGHVSEPMIPDARVIALRTQVEHARQEQQARRLQNSDLRERIDTHMRLEQLERDLKMAIDVATCETRTRLEEESRAELAELSVHILESSRRIDATYERVKRYDQQVQAYMEYKSVKERLRRLEENICMFREDQDNAHERIGRITTVIDHKKMEYERLLMYQSELETRRADVEACLRLNSLRSEWAETWFDALDERANAFWHMAKWDDRCSMHNYQLFREGHMTHCSRGMDMRRTICYFMALKELSPLVPYMVVNDVDLVLDVDGRVGLELLVQRWCVQDAVRTCWWLTRTREGSINMDGV